MATNNDGNTNSGALSRNFSSREYDPYKQQFDKSSTESRRRCEHALNDIDYYRDQHRSVMNPLEVATQDSPSLRSKYTDIVQENKQLREENQRLLQELTEHNGNGSETLFMSHKQALAKLEVAKDEKARLLNQYEVVAQERIAAQRDSAGLQQQLVKIYKDYAKLRESHQKLQQQYEEAVNVSIKANKDIKRLTDERNSTMTEYTLIMSERDSVHKEIEKLSEDITQAMTQIKILTEDKKDLQEEKRVLNYQMESLRREIVSALHERDKALKECNDLREKFGELGATSEDGRLLLGDQMKKSRGRLIDNSTIVGEIGVRKEHLREDSRSISQKQRLDNLDQANQELESLRKSLDKAQSELAEAIREAEVSKGRRDWAFSERDKIVLERESVRTLCDNMRKERDRAVSELAESLRESDAIKKQRNELLKENKELREALEVQIERERIISLNNIDDHPFGRTEILGIDLTRSDEEALEFTGGGDFPGGDGSVYIASVASGSSAIGKFFPHDRILRVNEVDCTHASVHRVVEAIRAHMPVANILLCRTRCARNEIGSDSEQVTKWIHTARLASGCHGLSLKMGVYINRISDGSLAAKDKSLTVGDRVLRINDKSMDDIETVREAMQALNDDSTDVISITTLKMSYPESPNVFTPVRRNKKENRSSQTEDWTKHGDYKYSNQEKNSSAWLKEKLELMRGPWRHSKEDKKKYRNSSPNPIDFGHEQAIAELDSVLDSFHNTKTIKRASGGAKRHISLPKEDKNNGGTWPKARATAVLTPGGGTVVTRTKERPPLSLLAQPKTTPEYYRNSTPVPLSLVPQVVPSTNRHSLYKSIETSHHFGMTADSFEIVKCGTNSKRHSANLNSDNSLDMPVQRLYDKELPCYSRNARSVNRYGSDSERDSIIGASHEIPPSHSRGPSQLFVPPRMHYPYHPHPHPHMNHSRESFSFEPYQHNHSPSVDTGSRRPPDLIETGGTFPRKREQRFRVPSNPSVTSKVSTGSIERGSSERGSPMPIFHVEVLSSPGDSFQVHGSKDYCPWGHKPLPGELRRVHIDKSNEPLGIQIADTGGIFVSTVTDGSLANRVGLQIGDQLLEVCGINMRNATYNLAANVLRQCGNSITMLVQYSPEKYHEVGGGAESLSGTSSNDDEEEEEEDDGEGEGEATPCNSPKEIRKCSAFPNKPSPLISMQRQSAMPNIGMTRGSLEEPRYFCIEISNNSNLGISLVGGNAAGIFVHSVQPNSKAYAAGLRTGDQILEYNGSDLRSATAEEAAYELAKPADKASGLAHYMIDRYNEIKDKPGDSLYIRCGFSRSGNDSVEPPQLSFNKDDVLYVDNTMFNGVPGQWRAWRLDSEGHRQQCGVIPSKYKVEEEMLLRRGAGDPVETRTAATARRSFFRRKKHIRGGNGSSGSNSSSSRDSKELASFCNLSPGWYSDSGSLHEDLSQMSYQRVEKLQYPEYRPVLVLGPLAECVADKLVSDFPEKFQRAVTETRRCNQATLDRELEEGAIIEYRRRGSCFECITVHSIKAVANARLHCMLDCSIITVQRLRRQQINPVVLLINFKTAKQIKEVKDARYMDKITAKAAKEMYEHGHKLEAEYRHLVTAVISAGANVAHVCAQIKAAVEAEHRKSQWVPVPTAHQ